MQLAAFCICARFELKLIFAFCTSAVKFNAINMCMSHCYCYYCNCRICNYFDSDLPVIVSGIYCGYLDPQEKVWKRESGKIFSLAELQKKSEILAQFVGLCGFQDDLTEFPGTLFRFPLRNKSSDLSEKTYEVKDVQTLIAAGKRQSAEAPPKI